ncbi:MAG: acetate/propionate family kinase [Leucobacter sp.]
MQQTTTSILVVNAGSSSIKYQLIDPRSEARLASGIVERIGQAMGRIEHQVGDRTDERDLVVSDHNAGFRAVIDAFERTEHPIHSFGVAAVGHRVVQGGSEFVAPTLIDTYVEQRIGELSRLAPLHNPPNLQAIVAAQHVFPDVPHVAVFDTAFHQTMPPQAYTYAVERSAAKQHGLRKYGFHGTSHQVVARRAAEFLERPMRRLNQIVLHLGNGASACAVARGASVDTSMGLTPLEGLVMGTRSGDLDPGALLHLLREGYDADSLDELLNRRSGLLGLAGSSDMRDVRAAADSGDELARQALDIYVQRIRHYIGAYLVKLGGADSIVFTAGVGENAAALRSEVCAGLEWFGIHIDAERNSAASHTSRRISTDDSRVAVLVIPTDEEAEIARQTWQLVTAP